MPIQLSIWERRDSADREALGNAALDMCRAARATEGIRSARFYWYGADTVVFLVEGEAAGLNALGTSPSVDYLRTGMTLHDLAKMPMSMRLTEPRAAEELYRAAGR